MGRGRKQDTDAALAQKIEEAQQKVIRTKAAHEKAVDELQKLLDKRDARRKEDIWQAIIRSDRSYEEILRFINTGIGADDEDA